MKKLYILIISYILMGLIFLSLINFISPSDIDGRYKTVEFARKAVPLYEDCEIICTADHPDGIVDFFLDKYEKFNVIIIKKYDNRSGHQYYSEVVTNRFNPDSLIRTCTDYFNQEGKNFWLEARGSIFVDLYNQSSVSGLPVIFWTILETECEINDSDVESYEFMRNEKKYVLHIKYGSEN